MTKNGDWYANDEPKCLIWRNSRWVKRYEAKNMTLRTSMFGPKIIGATNSI
jgi:hypothetical protein